MRASLFTRLLAVSILVATCSIIATALITSRVATDRAGTRFSEEYNLVEPVLEELISFARRHSDWSGIEPRLADLSDLYDVALVLVSSDGEIIAGTGDNATDRAVMAEVSPLYVPEPGFSELSFRDLQVGAEFESAEIYIPVEYEFNPLAAGGWRRIGLASLVVLSVVVTVTYLVGRRLTRPVRAMETSATAMALGERGGRVAVRGNDDIAELGRAFNSMSEAIERSEIQRKAIVSDVAHELRTPLTNVHGYLEATIDGVVALDAQLIRILHGESKHLMRLVDDVQDLALADAGKLSIHSEECDAVDLAELVLAAYRPRAIEVDVAMSLNGSVPVVVNADPVRLRQAIGNLVDNAIRHTPEHGAVAVDIRTEQTEVVIAVSDTGPGIAPENLERVFDRFFRTDPSRSRSSGGSGLGLTIARQAIEAMGGSVIATSECGQGAVFTIRLPHVPQPSWAFRAQSG